MCVSVAREEEEDDDEGMVAEENTQHFRSDDHVVHIWPLIGCMVLCLLPVGHGFKSFLFSLMFLKIQPYTFYS